jgi:hypothetical protein
MRAAILLRCSRNILPVKEALRAAAPAEALRKSLELDVVE